MKKWILTLILLVPAILLQAADLTGDPVIRHIEYSGVKNALKRILTESPLKEGDRWNESARNQLTLFIDKLKFEKIIEDNATLIDESVPEKGLVDLKITLSEQLPLFTIALPFYSTTNLLKIKLKYWQFYVDGYKVPLEGQIEFLQKDNINLFFKTNEPVRLNPRTTLEFEISAYTTTLNYLAAFSDPAAVSDQWNTVWRNGLDNLSASISYTIPKSEVTITPDFGMGYANVLIADPSGDLTAVKDQYHSMIINPAFGIRIPIAPLSAAVTGKLGFGYKYETVLNRDSSRNYLKQEISLSLMNNNPKDMPDPLAYPVTAYNFSIPVKPISATFSTGFKFAWKESFTSALNGGSVIGLLLQKEISPSVFEDTIIKNISDTAARDLILDSYPYDPDKKLYILDDTLSSAIKEKIWDSLVDIGYISNNGFIINPDIKFSFKAGSQPLYFIPELIFNYSNRSGTRSDGTSSFFYNDLSLKPVLTVKYQIPVIDTLLTVFINFKWLRIWYNNTQTGEISRLSNKLSIPASGVTIEKKMSLEKWFIRMTQASRESEEKSGHYILFQTRVEMDPLFSGSGDSLAANPSTFTGMLDFQYRLFLPVWRDSRFKLRFGGFYLFNHTDSKLFNETILGNWLRGKPAADDYFGGWFGAVLNLEYWFNLLNFDTPRFASIQMKKQFSWMIFWVIYADTGIALNHEKTDYTFSLGNLNLLPFFTLGTAFRAYPRFVPLMINLEVNYKLYNFLKNKDTFGNLYFEFSVSRVLDSSSWFSL